MSKTEVGSIALAIALSSWACYVISLSSESFICRINISMSCLWVDAAVKRACSIPPGFYSGQKKMKKNIPERENKSQKQETNDFAQSTLSPRNPPCPPNWIECPLFNALLASPSSCLTTCHKCGNS